MLAEPVQTTLEDGVPLSEVTFVVVDLETTGGSPTDARITEIGAVRLRGGERLGVFETLVNPRRADPTPHHAPHRDRRPDGRGCPADRVGAPVVRRVRARLRVRRAQRALRLLVPERRPAATRLRPAPLPAGVHRAPGSSRRLARRPERPPPDPRPVLQDRRPPDAPRPRGRRGLRGGAPRPARARRQARDRHARAICTAPCGRADVRTSARSGSPTASRTPAACTCSDPATGACSTSASPSTSGPA